MDGPGGQPQGQRRRGRPCRRVVVEVGDAPSGVASHGGALVLELPRELAAEVLGPREEEAEGQEETQMATSRTRPCTEARNPSDALTPVRPQTGPRW